MHEQADYYEADFDDDDPRLDLMLDCDTDLRLAHLWQHLFERDDVPEDALELVGALIRGAFDEGYNTAVVGDGDRRIDRQLRASGVRAGARPIRVTTRHTATRRSQSEYDPSQRPHLALAELPEGTVEVNRGHSCRAQPRFRLRGEQRSRQRGHSSVIQAATPQSRRGHPRLRWPLSRVSLVRRRSGRAAIGKPELLSSCGTKTRRGGSIRRLRRSCWPA
jgi:hypothetical protein